MGFYEDRNERERKLFTETGQYPGPCKKHEHEYSSWSCPQCGQDVCFSCSVRVTDASKAEGISDCFNCGFSEPYNQD